MENIGKKNKKRTQNFTTEMKKALAEEVKKHPRIWDLSDKLHSRKDALEQSWAEISKVIGVPATDCKAAWVSMRESYRYHARASRKGKSGDAGGESLAEPFMEEEYLDWEFAEEMSFLPNISQKRKTFSTFDAIQDFEIESESSQYNYSEPITSKRARQQPFEPDMDMGESESSFSEPSTSKKARQERYQAALTKQFGSLVENQKKLLEARADNKTKYQLQFATFEWLLNKLPPDVAENTCEEITSFLLERVKEQRENSQ